MPERILVVEDEDELAHLVELHLKDQGYDVVRAADGRRGLELARTRAFDLIVLDLMLPKMDGLEVCRRIRHNTDYTPILMITAKSSEIDRILGLEVGADDYLTKPFSIRELIARVRAIFRRVEALRAPSKEAPRIRIGELEIDLPSRRARLGEKNLQLTGKEFDLLAQFARNPGRVYSRSELLDQVWGYGHGAYEHTVNSHINRLRNKIEENPGKPRYILTVWGVGYKLLDSRETVEEED